MGHNQELFNGLGRSDANSFLFYPRGVVEVELDEE